MSVLCYMSLSFGCGRVCSCERTGCVLRTLYLYVVMLWFLCSQVVLAGGKYVLWRNFGCGCKGHMLFPGKRTDFAFWAKLILLAAARVYGRLHTL